MSNTYIASISYKTPVPRSERLRDAYGAGISSSSSSESSGDWVTRTTEQTITAPKAFIAGLDIAGGTDERTLYIDSLGALHCTIPFVSDSYISAGGTSSGGGGGGGGGTDLAAVWASLSGHTDSYASIQIDPAHLVGYLTSADIAGKENSSNKVTSLSSSSTNTQYPSAKCVYDALAEKQASLTFDSAPASGSTNPVTSGGIYTALDGKQDTLTAGTGITISGSTISVDSSVIGGDYIPLSGSSAITGGLVPNANASYNLGSNSYKWNYIYGTYIVSQSLAAFRGGVSISGGSSANCTFYKTTDGKLHVYPEMVFDNNTFLDNACVSITVPTGLSAGNLTSAGVIALSLASGYTIPTSAAISNISSNSTAIAGLQSYFTSGVANSAAALSCGDVGSSSVPVYFDDGVPVACSLDMSGYATSAQGAKADSALQTISLNGTTLAKSNNSSNVNACTSIGVPTGLSAGSLTNAGNIAISLTSGYTIPTSTAISNISSNSTAIAGLRSYFTNGVANSAAALSCGDVGSSSVPVYFDDGVPVACSLDMSGYATSAQGAKADSALQTISLNGTTLAKSNNSSNVNACTSIGVPTGLSAGSLTSAGVITLSLTSGYKIPTTTEVSNGTTAYGWGNHADAGYLTSADGKITINGTQVSLGGSFSTASITAGTAGTSSATSSLQSLAVPYVTMNAYGIVTAYGTHTHTLMGSSSIGSASLPVYYNGSSFASVTGSSLFSALSSTAATNLSVTVAGQQRTVTLYATYDSDSENIATNMGIIGKALVSLQSQIDSVASRDGFETLTAMDATFDSLSVGGKSFFGSDLCLMSGAYLNLTSDLSASTGDWIGYDSGDEEIAFDFVHNCHFYTGLYSDSYITAGASGSSSDRRLKDDLERISAERAWDVLKQLKPMEWVWNEKNAYLSGKRGAGLVAQDVADVLPDAVIESGKYLSLNYSVMHAYEIAGLQDHEGRIEALESEVKRLAMENMELKNKLQIRN